MVNISRFLSTSNTANTALTVARGSYDNSNTKFNTSGGNITGPVTISSTLTVTGNVTFSGNVTTVSANNLAVQDNMIYLNDGSNNTNPDLGISGNYNDGSYKHTGFFRDASDGIWKLFDNYTPEPDASPYIDTSNSSFRFANFQANTVYSNVLSSSSLTSNTLSLNAGTSSGVLYLNGNKEVTSGSALTFDGTNVGIGISSPTQKLDISSGGKIYLRRSDNATGSTLSNGGSGIGQLFNEVNGDGYTFQNSGSNIMRLDASGNLGLGVTLNAWRTSYNTKVIQFGPVGSICSLSASTTNNQTYFNSNAYLATSDWIYMYSDKATSYQQYAGKHIWWNAPTGTAGDAISFTQAMTLDNSGNLGIGVTSITNGKVQIYSSSGNTLSLQKSNGAAGIVFGSNVTDYAIIESIAAGGLNFYVGDGTLTKRITLDTLGNLGIGTASPSSMLHVAGNITSSGLFPWINLSTSSWTSGAYIQSGVNSTGISSGDYLTFGIPDSKGYSFTANGVPKLIVNTSGNVGVGTSSPAVKLHVSGEVIRVESGENYGGNLSVKNTLIEYRVGMLGAAGTNAYSVFDVTNSQDVDYYSPTTGVRAFYTSGTERMRLDSSGNLGIGTTSPTNKLQVVGNIASSGHGTLLALNNTSDGVYIVGGNANYNAFSVGDYGIGSVGALKFATNNNAINMTLDASGNLGLGVTPSAWVGGSKAIQLSYGALSSGYNYSIEVSNNAYRTGASWGYYVSGQGATLYEGIGAQHKWYNAPSGTAGNAIPFTQAMTLDASGNLGLGVSPSPWTSDAGKVFEIGGGASITGNQTSFFQAITNAYYNGSNYIYKNSDFSTRYVQNVGVHSWSISPSGTAGNAIPFTQAMTLDASGNLAINTTSGSGGRVVIAQSNATQPAIYLPTDESTIQGPNSNTQIRMGSNLTLQSGNVTGINAKNASGYIYFSTGSTPTERMRIDSSGNLGLGVTPSAWDSSYKSFQVVYGLFAGNTGSVQIGHNWFYNGGLKYISSDFSSNYRQYRGQHIWETAPSGTAGAAITFTQAMTLDANGNLMLGATTSSGVLYIQNSTNPSIRMGYGGSNALNELTWDSSDFVISADRANAVASNLIFKNDGTERMRIDSSGNLGIGSTSPLGRVHITSPGITAAAPSLGWPVYNSELDTNSKSIYIDTSGNSSNTTAGYGSTVSIVLGSYHDSRSVITPLGAGGGSPSDQGTGYGKDLMVKAGTSDNTSGKVGGRLFLSGGSGYSSAFNTNYGNVILQPFGGYVGIGTSSPSKKLTISRATESASEQLEFRNEGSISTGNYDGIVWTQDSTVLSSIRVNYNSSGFPDLSFSLRGISNLLFLKNDGNVGIGTTSPGYKLEVAGSLKTTGTVYNAANMRTYSVSVSPIPNQTSTYEIMRVSQDYVNWSTQSTYQIIVDTTYFSGGVTKWNLTYAFGSKNLICTECSGSNTLRVYLGTEVVISGNVKYVPVLVDIPAYNGCKVEVRYYSSEVTSTPTFSGQVQFTGTRTNGAGTGNYHSTSMIGPSFSNTGSTKLLISTGSNGWPSTSGTSQSSGALRLRGSDNAVLDFGVNSSGGGWIQSTDGTSLDVNYPMLLNPNGGNVGIGTLSPSTKLDISYQASFNTTTPGFTKYGLHFSGQVTNDYATGITFSAGGAAGNNSHSGIYSQGSPSYGTKLYFATTNDYGVGAKTRMMIDQEGNLSIGTTNPFSKTHIHTVGLNIVSGNAIQQSSMAGLTITNSQNDNSSVGVWFGTSQTHWCGISGQRTNYSTTWGTDLRFYTHEDSTNDVTYTRERMRLDSSGNLAIGTTSPSAKLHVNNNGATTRAFYVDAGNYSSTSQILFEHTGSSTPVPFRITKSGYSGATSNYGIMHFDMADNTVGNGSNIYFTLRDSSNNLAEYGGIGAQIRTNTAGSISGDLSLYTSDSGSTRLERIRITSAGMVGINNTSPSLNSGASGLNITNSSYTQLQLKSASGSGGLELLPSSGHLWEVQASNANTYLIYNRTLNQYKLTIQSNGNTAIGYNNDSDQGYKLAVNGSFAATTKSFVIDHPTKPDHKLRYGSLEGPENGVYIRGKLKGSNIIELPEYWTNLVDPDSITVNLTPIGKFTELYIEDITNNNVIIGGNDINCFYTVFAERIDVDKLIVEFKNGD